MSLGNFFPITAVTFTRFDSPHTLYLMHLSAAVLCRDKKSLAVLKAVLTELGIELEKCSSEHESLEAVMSGRCSTLIVDFDLPGAEEVIRMAALLPPGQKPELLAVASRAWPGTGQAFQSGASRIFYRPLDVRLLKDALKAGNNVIAKNRRKSTRYEAKTLVYLELESGTVPAVSIDIGAHGLAIQATEPIPMSANCPFHCVLPGTDFTLQGHADVIWASDLGRAGLFFSKLSSPARKHLKRWLAKRAAHSKEKHPLHNLMPHDDGHVSFAARE